MMLRDWRDLDRSNRTIRIHEETRAVMQKATREQFLNLKRIVQAHGKLIDCPIWPDCQAWLLDSGDIAVPKRVWSPRSGGVFSIPAGFPLQHINIPDQETRKLASSWIWEQNTAFEDLGDENDEATLPELTQALIQEISNRKPLSIEQRVDRALKAIGKPPVSILSKTTIGLSGDQQEQKERKMQFEAATECGDSAGEMDWLLEELEQSGFVRLLPMSEPVSDQGPRVYRLTFKGLGRLETGGEALVSNTVFVAMWFDNEIKGALEEGIAPAIREAGFKPLPINWKEHSNKICDEIVAEILRARFLVCDFTCGLLEDKSGETAIARGGVYYEAGLAHGLGKKVIWTCRSDLIHHVHFDLRQYNTILWNHGKEDELRRALLDRIRAEIN